MPAFEFTVDGRSVYNLVFHQSSRTLKIVSVSVDLNDRHARSYTFDRDELAHGRLRFARVSNFDYSRVDPLRTKDVQRSYPQVLLLFRAVGVRHNCTSVSIPRNLWSAEADASDVRYALRVTREDEQGDGFRFFVPKDVMATKTLTGHVTHGSATANRDATESQFISCSAVFPTFYGFPATVTDALEQAAQVSKGYAQDAAAGYDAMRPVFDIVLLDLTRACGRVFNAVRDARGNTGQGFANKMNEFAVEGVIPQSAEVFRWHIRRGHSGQLRFEKEWFNDCVPAMFPSEFSKIEVQQQRHYDNIINTERADRKYLHLGFRMRRVECKEAVRRTVVQQEALSMLSAAHDSACKARAIILLRDCDAEENVSRTHLVHDALRTLHETAAAANRKLADVLEATARIVVVENESQDWFALCKAKTTTFARVKQAQQQQHLHSEVSTPPSAPPRCNAPPPKLATAPPLVSFGSVPRREKYSSNMHVDYLRSECRLFGIQSNVGGHHSRTKAEMASTLNRMVKYNDAMTLDYLRSECRRFGIKSNVGGCHGRTKPDLVRELNLAARGYA